MKFFIYISICFILLSCISIKTKQNIAQDYFILANEYLSLNNYKKAIDYYNKAYEYDNTNNDIILNIILCYIKDNQFDKAEELIIKYYKPTINEFNQKLLLILGNNYYYKEDYSKALKVLKLYIELYPSDINGYFNLALIYLKLNEEQTAIKYFLECYKINDKFIPALFNLGEYYFNKKDFKLSYQYFKQLIELDKDNPDVFYKTGLMEFNNEDYELAKNNLITAINLDNKNNNYYLLLARIYAKGYNDKKNCLLNLEESFKNGFNDISTLQSYQEFNILNEFPEYKELLIKYNLIKNINTTTTTTTTTIKSKK